MKLGDYVYYFQNARSQPELAIVTGFKFDQIFVTVLGAYHTTMPCKPLSICKFGESKPEDNFCMLMD